MDKLVILDMDGVLADFGRQAFWAFDREYNVDVLEAGNWYCLEKELCGGNTDDFWGKVNLFGENFWKSMKETGEAGLLVSEIKSRGYGLMVCTAAADSPASWSGKRIWMRDHFPDIPVCIMKDKFLLAGRDRVLVDDNDENCRKFQLAGGGAVVVPRRWNSCHAAAATMSAGGTVEFVMGLVDHYFVNAERLL